MSEMVERVAKAVAEAEYGMGCTVDNVHIRQARAAIEAMREPLPEMIGAWYRYKNGHHFQDEPPPDDTSDYGAYRAMISAALT